ncbi:hypothetical protein QQ045_000731 [Rhodiola kirilowii]
MSSAFAISPTFSISISGVSIETNRSALLRSNSPDRSRPDEKDASGSLVLLLVESRNRGEDGRREWLLGFGFVDVATGVICKAINLRSSIRLDDSDCKDSCEVSLKKLCAECGTSKTPLWRSGPAGPKSLCNACGVKRNRNKRRALLDT